MALCAAAVLLGPAAASAQASPSAGDVSARRAIDRIVRIDRAATWTEDYALFGVSLSLGPVALERRARALRDDMGAAGAQMRRAGPTSAEGRRMRRLGLRAVAREREFARLVAASQRALRRDDDGRSIALELRGGRVYAGALRLMASARRIVLPDPLAGVEAIRFVGAVSGGTDDDPAALPILAEAGGVMRRCAPTDRLLGWRLFARGVRGQSILRFATTEPGGAVTRTPVRVRAANDGVEVTAPVEATGDGLYRLVIEQGGRVLLDVSITRACRPR